jgi:hypothetical protein
MRTKNIVKLIETQVTKHPYLSKFEFTKDGDFLIQNRPGDKDGSFVILNFIHRNPINAVDIYPYCQIFRKAVSDIIDSSEMDVEHLFIVIKPEVLFEFLLKKEIKNSYQITYNDLENGNVTGFLNYISAIIKIWEDYTANFDLEKVEKEVNVIPNKRTFPPISYLNCLALGYLYNNDLENLLKYYGNKMSDSSEQSIRNYNKLVRYICIKKNLDENKYLAKEKWYKRLFNKTQQHDKNIE